ncbi:MAG: FAD-binding protein [Vampirovibrionales bacterium]
MLEHTMVAKLLVRDGTCCGAIVVGPGQRHPQPRMVLASHTVLATGGLGQLYEHTTNPPIATADGIALASGGGHHPGYRVCAVPHGLLGRWAGAFPDLQALRGEEVCCSTRPGNVLCRPIASGGTGTVTW